MRIIFSVPINEYKNDGDTDTEEFYYTTEVSF